MMEKDKTMAWINQAELLCAIKYDQIENFLW